MDYQLQLIGTLLFTPGGLKYLGDIGEEHFEGIARSIFSACKRLHNAGELIILETLQAEVGNYDPDIWELVLNSKATYHSIPLMIKRLIDMSRKERLKTALQLSLEHLDSNYEKAGVADDVIAMTSKQLDLCVDSTSKAMKLGDTGDSPDRFIKDYKTTGVSSLDDRIMGIKPGQFIVIAARPGEGKTTLSMNIAHHVSQWTKVLFFTLEMTLLELELKVLSSMTQINSLSIEHNALNEKELVKYHRAQQAMKDINWSIYEPDSLSQILSISERTRDVGLIVVDYIQLCKVHGIRDRHLQIAEITGRLKQLAMKKNCTVIGVSQLNRIKDDEEPSLINLRESGSLEQDANTVIFIFKESLIVAKNRGGMTGTVPVRYNRATHTFTGPNNMEALNEY